MNGNLAAIIKQIIAEEGEGVLKNAQRFNGILSDRAPQEPKARKKILVKCIECGFPSELQNAPDRAVFAATLARRLSANEGFDLTLCHEALDTLTAVLFGTEAPIHAEKPAFTSQSHQPYTLNIPVKTQYARTKQKTGAKKKKSALRVVLIASTVVALAFLVIVAVITYNNIMNNGGSESRTAAPAPVSPSVGKQPEYSMFTIIGIVRTRTKDPMPFPITVDMVLAYDMNDRNAQTELTSRLYELRDFVRSYFSGKYAAELQPENEAILKNEIVELLNTKVLTDTRIRNVLFRQLDIKKD